MTLSHRAFTLHSGCSFSPFTTVVVSRAKFQKKRNTKVKIKQNRLDSRNCKLEASFCATLKRMKHSKIQYNTLTTPPTLIHFIQCGFRRCRNQVPFPTLIPVVWFANAEYFAYQNNLSIWNVDDRLFCFKATKSVTRQRTRHCPISFSESFLIPWSLCQGNIYAKQTKKKIWNKLDCWRKARSEFIKSQEESYLL